MVFWTKNGSIILQKRINKSCRLIKCKYFVKNNKRKNSEHAELTLNFKHSIIVITFQSHRTHMHVIVKNE